MQAERSARDGIVQRGFKSIINVKSLFPVMAAVYVYGIAGVAWRRLVCRGMLTVTLVVSEQDMICKEES